jgi:peptidylprolyl isomerase
MVIAGWDQGIEGMKVGGRRRSPSRRTSATATAAPGAAIKPGETLIFVVDLTGRALSAPA